MKSKELQVSETFISIQGESTFAGRPCFFIRLSGCNLRCNYCDTSYAYEEEGKSATVEELVKKAEDSGVRIVEVTGGEPLLQEATTHLITALCDSGFTVLVETNGTKNIDAIDPRAITILDIKTPGSGYSDRMDMANLYRLRTRDEIKFVITNKTDYEWTKEILLRHGLRGGRVLLSPAKGVLAPEELAEWILQDRLNVRLNLQLHKYIYGDRRGV